MGQNRGKYTFGEKKLDLGWVVKWCWSLGLESRSVFYWTIAAKELTSNFDAVLSKAAHCWASLPLGWPRPQGKNPGVRFEPRPTHFVRFCWTIGTQISTVEVLLPANDVISCDAAASSWCNNEKNEGSGCSELFRVPAYQCGGCGFKSSNVLSFVFAYFRSN